MYSKRLARLSHTFALLATPFLVPGAAGNAAAQQPTETMLQPAARLAEPFSRIRGIRELSDGRVLVSDQTEKGVFMVDFRAQTRTMLGHNGPGPEEYAMPIGLLALPGDTTLLIDLGNTRLSTLAPDGSIVGSRILFAREGLAIPHYADDQRRLYYEDVTAVRMAKRQNPDASTAHVLRTAGTDAVDTVATYEIPGGTNPSAIPDWDFYTVSPDGWVAVIRNTGGYRIEWTKPDGTLVRGEPVDYPAVKIDGKDREIFEKPVKEGGMGGGGGNAVRFGDSNNPPPKPPARQLPDPLPPATYDRAWIASDGRAWVQRNQHLHEKRPLFDVFDRTGRRVAVYRLPENRTMVGFGNGVAYAYATDDDGLQWLERYPMR
jgi:hypothetical protein